ncbi:IS3 family transposase [bacterium]|nr:IS3 family transposase [bacterium]
MYKLNIKQMTFNEFENEIDDFIHYYNNVRTREKLN